jgi:hypothetical protein
VLTYGFIRTGTDGWSDAAAIASIAAERMLHNALLRWASVPLGVVTGVVLYTWLGRLGYRRLAARGPEMLLKMRVGRSSESRSGDQSAGRASDQPRQAGVQVAGRNAAVIGVGIPLAAILLFPQGIVPLILKLAHARARVWFLPLYLPKPLQWPACFVMIVLGVAVAWLVLSTAAGKELRCWKGGGGREVTEAAIYLGHRRALITNDFRGTPALRECRILRRSGAVRRRFRPR